MKKATEEIKDFWFGTTYVVEAELYFKKGIVFKKFIPRINETDYVIVEIFPRIPYLIQIVNTEINLDVKKILRKFEELGKKNEFTLVVKTPRNVKISIQLLTDNDFACKGFSPLAIPGDYRMTIHYIHP